MGISHAMKTPTPWRLIFPSGILLLLHIVPGPVLIIIQSQTAPLVVLLLHNDLGLLVAFGECGGDDGTDGAGNALLWQITEHVLLVVVRDLGGCDVSVALAGVDAGRVWVAGTVLVGARCPVSLEKCTQQGDGSSDHDNVVFSHNTELKDCKVVGEVVSVGQLSDFDGFGDRSDESTG